MKKYIINYISNSGLLLLGVVVEAHSRDEAIEDIKGDTGVYCILSLVEVK